jgi:hypothetical protein
MQLAPKFRHEVANMAAHGADISTCGEFLLMTRVDNLAVWFWEDDWGNLSDENFDQLYPRVDLDTEGASIRRKPGCEPVARMLPINIDAELIFYEDK